MNNPNLDVNLLPKIARLSREGYSMGAITKLLELGPKQLFYWYSRGKEDSAKGETSLYAQVYRAIEESNSSRVQVVEDKLFERITEPEFIINRDASGKVKDIQERPPSAELTKFWISKNKPEKYGDQVRVDIRGVEDIIPQKRSIEEIMAEMKGMKEANDG